jgi:hypothetical protein
MVAPTITSRRTLPAPTDRQPTQWEQRCRYCGEFKRPPIGPKRDPRLGLEPGGSFKGERYNEPTAIIPSIAIRNSPEIMVQAVYAFLQAFTLAPPRLSGERPSCRQVWVRKLAEPLGAHPFGFPGQAGHRGIAAPWPSRQLG